MILRHRLTNPMLAWRALHALRLWVLARIVMIALAWLFRTGEWLIPLGVDYSVLAAILVASLDWLDELRFSLKIVYANLGYGFAAVRLVVLLTALAAELVFALVMLALRQVA